MKGFGFIVLSLLCSATPRASEGALLLPQHIQRHDDVALVSLPVEGVVAFQLTPAPVLSEELRARFPKIKTFSGTSVDNRELKIRLEESSAGRNARIFGDGKNFYLDRFPEHLDRTALAEARQSHSFQCLTETAASPLSPPSLDKPPKATNAVHDMRSFRLAIAATGEYTEFHGGTVESALAAIVTVINRINSIYERELGIRLVLVANNDQVIFTDKNSDPFSHNGPSLTTVSEAQTVFDTMIGSENYDVGMVFNTGNYGLAFLAAVCDPHRKGSSCMGLPQPVGEQFTIYAAHELAHMFGANHSFNSDQGFCGGNRTGASAVEPGTGSTIMSYAGLPCGSNSLQPLMDDYFHAQSIAEVQQFLTNSVACATFITVTNHVPTVQAGPEYTIPHRTPFTLTAIGSDADQDLIYYCWEQMDTGPADSLTDPDNGLSPLFRSFVPTTNATRTFPRLENILQNDGAGGEKMPNTVRSLHFRVTARDSKDVGALATSDTHVHIVTNAGPFRILSHNTSLSLRGEQTVLWDIANTTNAPVNTSAVNILLSTNGGASFNIVLAANTPNDGNQTVMLPHVDATHARIKVEAIDNIFFDINDANLTLSTRPCFTGIETVSGGVRLRWTRQAGKHYRIDGTDSLVAPAWQEISVTQTPNGSEMQATVPFGALATRYFRVQEE